MKIAENLMELIVDYVCWRTDGAESDVPFTWDSGEAAARADFTEYAKLENDINFETMYVLEENYVELDVIKQGFMLCRGDKDLLQNMKEILNEEVRIDYAGDIELLTSAYYLDDAQLIDLYYRLP